MSIETPEVAANWYFQALEDLGVTRLTREHVVEAIRMRDQVLRAALLALAAEWALAAPAASGGFVEELRKLAGELGGGL